MRSVAALLILAIPLVSRAEPPALTAPLAPPAEQPAVEHTSYAAYTLTADALSVGALLGGGT